MSHASVLAHVLLQECSQLCVEHDLAIVGHLLLDVAIDDRDQAFGIVHPMGLLEVLWCQTFKIDVIIGT
jgi:hypothetical protein